MISRMCNKSLAKANKLPTILLRMGSSVILHALSILVLLGAVVIPLNSAQASQNILKVNSEYFYSANLPAGLKEFYGTKFKSLAVPRSKSDTSVFKLLSTDPVIGYFPAGARFIKFSFNKNLTSSLSVSGTTGLISSHSIIKSDLVIILNETNPNIIYHVMIGNIHDVEGQKIKDMVLSFKPKILPESSFSAAQMKAQMQAQQNYNVAVGDALIHLLPFHSGGGEFLVSYDLKYSGLDTIPIVIITAPDQKSKNDALAWIKLVGADPSKYQIRYITTPVP